MKVIAYLDSAGHFDVVPLTNRAKVIEVLQQLQDGDFWANIVEESNYQFDKTGFILCEEEWGSEIRGFSQRGILEIVEI